MNNTLHEPARETPIEGHYDVCIIGGSCTGVFAAIRAADLGLSVALVEQNILFGGMAVAAQVSEWHSLSDAHDRNQIIGGLTAEVLRSLEKRQAVLESTRADRGTYYLFNSTELALELDERVRNHPNIRPFLKATCVGAVREDNALRAAIIEDKSGRRAIRARFFIDASGDGDLLRRGKLEAWKNSHLQPVTYQVMVSGLNQIQEESGRPIWPQISDLADQYNYPRSNATPWINRFAGVGDLRNLYGPRLNGVDASDADQLTQGILESRRCHRALHDMMRKRFGHALSPVFLSHAMGVRETWHADCHHRLTAQELLSGIKFDDRIACGTYPVDVHSPEGTLLRFLDGREHFVTPDGVTEKRRWQDPGDTSACYFIPYRSLVPRNADNLLVCGRLLDADREAFGGVRVMVNMNQTGEAVGIAAWLALKNNQAAANINVGTLREHLRDSGSLLP